MKNKTKKIIAIIAISILFIASLSLNSFATFITDINSNATFGVIEGSLSTYKHELHYTTYDDITYILFCTQYGVKSPTGKEYSIENDFIVENKSNLAQYEKMAEMIYFGYTMNYGMGLPITLEAQRAACCTQQYVWEYVKNNIDNNLRVPERASWDSKYMSESIYDDWLTKTENYYNIYNSNVSFNNTTNKVNIREETIITDTNEVLQYYDTFNQTINEISFSHERGSNDLKIFSSNSGLVNFNSGLYGIYKLMPNGNLYTSGTMSNYVYFNFKSENVQNLIFSNFVNPSSLSISAETQAGKISIKKINNMGNAVAGCDFELYTDEDCTQKIAIGVSDSNGQVVFDELKSGLYYIKETSASNGYSIEETVKRVQVVPGQVSCIDFENSEPTGIISIKKIDSETEEIPQGEASFENAKYEVYAKEDIYNVAKTKKFYSKGDLVATRITDEKGETEDIIDLPLGNYIVKEVVSPTGYFLDTNEYEVNLEYKNQETKIIKSEVISKETVKKMHVYIFKSGLKINSDKKVGLEGARFIIKSNKDVQLALDNGYTNEEIWNGINENGDNVLVDENRVAEAQKIAPNYAVITTDKDGNAYTENKLPYGEYILRETEAPKGFIISNKPILFKVDVLENYDGEYVKEIMVENEQPIGNLEIHKKIVLNNDIDTSLVDVSNLSEIEFTLTAKDNIVDYSDNSIIHEKGEEISKYNLDEKGRLVITDLPMGKYELQETKTINGFILDNKKYDVNFIQEDLITKEYEVKEEIKNNTTICEFSKIDIETGEKLTGAKLVLLDEEKNIIDTWISSIKPHRIEGLNVGKKFILKEEIAPEGYEIAEEISFIVKNTSTIQLIEMKDKVIIIEEPPIPEEPIKEVPELPEVLPVTGDSNEIAFYIVLVEVLFVLLITFIRFKIVEKIDNE